MIWVRAGKALGGFMLSSLWGHLDWMIPGVT